MVCDQYATGPTLFVRSRVSQSSGPGWRVAIIDGAKRYSLVEYVVGQLNLTPKQRQITLMLATGHDSTSIMERLCIRPGTLRTHKRGIFSKLGVHSQVELVARIHTKALEMAT